MATARLCLDRNDDNVNQPRTYLDNAATSWPKPETVYDAVDQYQREIGVAAGRGSYRVAEDVERTITRLRLNLCKVIGADSANPRQCVFTQNCTDALNLALHGILRTGDHVITTVVEHNSIIRPLRYLEKNRNVQVTTVNVNDQGVVDLEELTKSFTSKTKLVAITHASNVTGALQPIAKVGALSKENDALFLLDAAQTLGHVPTLVEQNYVDFLAAPGHKGLLGPLGTGFLYVASTKEADLESHRQGGTGTESELAEQPQELPAKYEAGNANVPGLVGLDAGVQFVQTQDETHFHQLLEFTGETVAGLSSIDGVTVYSEANPCGIVAFNVSGFDPREMATMLDASANIELRAGLHCAPGTHKRLGTFSEGGCVRASFGHFSSRDEVAKLLEAIRAFAEID